MRTITITMSIPPMPLSPNWRGHWAVKAKAKAAHRKEASVRAYLAMRMLTDQSSMAKASATATFYHATNRARDGDNALASLKAAYDGIADAKVVGDDKHFIHHPVVFEKDKARPRVEIEIREVGEDHSRVRDDGGTIH